MPFIETPPPREPVPTTGSIPIVPVKTVGSRLKSMWMFIPDPRIVSLIIGFSYLVFLTTGIVTLALPPSSIEAEYGDVVMQLVGYFFIAGSIIGMIGGTTEFWQLERVGIAGMAVGLFTYLYIVINLQVAAEAGNRYTQMGVIVLALCLLVNRLARIWRYDFKPRG